MCCLNDICWVAPSVGILCGSLRCCRPHACAAEMNAHLQMRLPWAAAALAPVCMLIIAVMVILAHLCGPADALTRCSMLFAALPSVSKVGLDGPARIAMGWRALVGIAGKARSHAHAVLPVPMLCA